MKIPFLEKFFRKPPSIQEEYEKRAKAAITLVPPYPLFISENPPSEKTPEQQRLQEEDDKKYPFLSDPEVKAAYEKIDNLAIREACKKIDKFWHDYIAQLPPEHQELRDRVNLIYQNTIKDKFIEENKLEHNPTHVMLQEGLLTQEGNFARFDYELGSKNNTIMCLQFDSELAKTEIEKRCTLIHELTHLVDLAMIHGFQNVDKGFYNNEEQDKIDVVYVETNVAVMESVLVNSIPRSLYEKDIEKMDDKTVAKELLELFDDTQKTNPDEYQVQRVEEIYNQLSKAQFHEVQANTVFEKPRVMQANTDFFQESKWRDSLKDPSQNPYRGR